jgi:CIC family chloride channel protein
MGMSRRLKAYFHILQRKMRVPHSYFLVFLAVIVGYVTAMGAFIFSHAVQTLEDFSFNVLNQWGFWFLLLPAVGGLFCGLILTTYSDERRERGVSEVIFAVLVKGGIIRLKAAVAELVATVVCLGTLGSAGRQGPMVMIGSATGSYVAQLLKLSSNSIKILTGCGAAAGISATFNAPIGGVLFALEVILHTFSPSTFTPIIVASVISAVTFHSLSGSHRLFEFHIHYQESVISFFTQCAVGISCGLLSVLFISLWGKFRRWFNHLPVSPWMRPSIGGLITGLIVINFPQLAGSSYTLIERLGNDEFSSGVIFLLLLLLFKILATIFTLTSGGAGGVFAPSLVLGAITGYTVHLLVVPWYPTIDGTSCVIVGMASFVAGTTHAPIAAILVLCEMSGSFQLILPLLAGCILSIMVSRVFSESTLYTLSLKERGIHLKDGHDLDVLKTYMVRDVMDTEVSRIREDSTLFHALTVLNRSASEYVAVMDSEDNVVGFLSHHDVGAYLLDESRGLDSIVRDAMHVSLVKVSELDPILAAYEKFRSGEQTYIPVYKKDGSFCGLIFKRDLIRSYRARLNRKSMELYS